MRRRDVITLIGGAALAMLGVMAAMSVMPDKRPEMIASGACFGIIVVALVIKRLVRKPAHKSA